MNIRFQLPVEVPGRIGYRTEVATFELDTAAHKLSITFSVEPKDVYGYRQEVTHQYRLTPDGHRPKESDPA